MTDAVNRRRSEFLAFACLMCVSSTGHATGPSSDFDEGLEGWSVEVRNGSYTTVLGTFTPSFVPTGGDPGGHIDIVDPTGDFTVFVAPPSFLGPRPGAIDGSLRFSQRTTSRSFSPGFLVVLFGDGINIAAPIPTPELNVWESVTIPLTDGGWRVGTTLAGRLATPAEVAQALGDIQTLLIGAEFGGDVAEERVGLDSVRLTTGPCGPADLAVPFGVIAPADAQAFLHTAAGDPAFVFTDAISYLRQYDAGCSD